MSLSQISLDAALAEIHGVFIREAWRALGE